MYCPTYQRCDNHRKMGLFSAPTLRSNERRKKFLSHKPVACETREHKSVPTRLDIQHRSLSNQFHTTRRLRLKNTIPIFAGFFGLIHGGIRLT